MYRTPPRGTNDKAQTPRQPRQSQRTDPVARAPRNSPNRFRLSPSRDQNAGLELQYWDRRSQTLVRLKLRKFDIACIVIVLCTVIISVFKTRVSDGELKLLAVIGEILIKLGATR